MNKDAVTDTAEHLKEQAETVNNQAKEVKKMAEGASIAMAEMRLQMETLVEVHKEEKADMRKHYGRIIMALILVICLIIGSVIGAVIYIISNYDIGVLNYAQDLYIGNDGTNTISDGIHYSFGADSAAD